MSLHALEVLEFERVLERVARHAASESGRQRVMSLRPDVAVGSITRELQRVAATMRFVVDDPDWAVGPIPDVGSDLAQLPLDGAVLEPLALHRIGVLLATSRLLATEFEARPGSYEELKTLRDALVDGREVEKRITRAVDAHGEVLSTASKQLKRIRDRLRGAHTKIVRKLEAYLPTLAERFIVPDGSVTIREGRYVIPVRREGKGEVGGIVHDESQTGATLYIEPPVAIELMNQLRDLEREEAREIRRVLGELTGILAPQHAALEGALHALVDFDALLARARTAIAWGASVPEMHEAPRAELRIRDGRHPLLLESSEEAVVAFDLDLSPEERCLVVSGPNTGGKSVFLKATGLISTLAQSGVVPPVGDDTSLPVFMSFFADIGDEQSITRNLSTFSAHLANLADLVTEADGRSLILIDEMGTGTDPAEGAALARAVIEELVERGATTLVSSHLGDLKRLDAEGSGVVNASLQFDPERMEPTFRFVKGRPGRSYGLAIARKLGFPEAVLDRAERYRGEEATDLEELLARLEEQEIRAAKLVHELDIARARAERLNEELETRESKVSEAERTASDRARKDARKLLLDARAEVEEAIEELRVAAQRGEALDDAAREARRRVEDAAGRQLAAVEEATQQYAAVGDLALEDEVRIHATGARGRVVELRAGRALVETGSLRLEVPVDELRRAEPRGQESEPKRGGWSGPARGRARTEIDLRGLRVDEMELELERALDQAVLEDLTRLRIIHGKGTGALRKRVAEILQVDRRVRDFRMGGPGEGGAGVTVAVLGTDG
jgi:DNA mismatch repair protein MutS2